MPRRRRQRGEGLGDILRKVHNFVKSNRLISRAASALSTAGVPHAGTIGTIARTAGYGRRKRGRRRK